MTGKILKAMHRFGLREDVAPNEAELRLVNDFDI